MTEWGDEPVGDGPLPHVERALAAVFGALEHVVDREQPAGKQMPRPTLVVGHRDRFRVAAVDEQERERRRPRGGDHRRVTDDADHAVFQPGGLDRLAEERQRVHAPGAGSTTSRSW